MIISPKFGGIGVLTGSRAIASDANGKLAAATTTAAELDFLSGATSNIQTQINALGGGGGLVRISQFLGEVTSTGTGETDLHSHSVAAQQFSFEGDTLKLKASGYFQASIRTKKLRVIFGGAVLLDTGDLALTDFTYWTIDAEVHGLNADTQHYSVNFLASALGFAVNTAQSQVGVISVDGASSQSFVITGTVGGAGGTDISDLTSLLDFMPSGVGAVITYPTDP